MRSSSCSDLLIGSWDLSGNIVPLVDVASCLVVILDVDDFTLLEVVVVFCFLTESDFAPVLDFDDVVRIISDGMVAVGFEGVVDFNFSPTTGIDVEGAVTAGAVTFEGSE